MLVNYGDVIAMYPLTSHVQHELTKHVEIDLHFVHRRVIYDYGRLMDANLMCMRQNLRDRLTHHFSFPLMYIVMCIQLYISSDYR